MPLDKSGSKEAFSNNVSAEMHAGKPQKQALAIAYSVKRRGKADGGAEYPSRAIYTVHGALPKGNRLDPPKRRSDYEMPSETVNDAFASFPPKQGLAFGGPPAPWQARQEAYHLMHTGPIMSGVAGRTDHHNMNVPGGSYVLPADHISSLGQGNTLNGMKVVNNMFRSGPYGVSAGSIKHGPGAPKPPKAPAMMKAKGGLVDEPPLVTGNPDDPPAAFHRPPRQVMPPVRNVYPDVPDNQEETEMRKAHFKKFFGLKSGGKTDGIGEPVPIAAAGGEDVLSPDEIMNFFGGKMSLKDAHAALDKWVITQRKRHIKTLKGLPGPAKD